MWLLFFFIFRIEHPDGYELKFVLLLLSFYKFVPVQKNNSKNTL